VGLATIYVAWGSTFLAIEVALRTLPPFTLMAARHLVAGLLLLGWALLRGAPRPDRRAWLAAFVVGACLFLAGHGSLAWAQQRVTAGVAALVAGTIPLWLVVVDRVAVGQRLSRAAVVGLVLGFGGVVILVGLPGPGEIDAVATAVLLAGAVAWAVGSVGSRGAGLPSDPLLVAAMSTLAGGILLAVAAAAGGELTRLDWAGVSAESVGAVAYLVVVGSVLGFSVYTWLLRTTSTSLVATYAFVNPIVAIALGGALLDEEVTLRVLLAAVTIVGAVALIVRAQRAGYVAR
jgi:drug/metabolite transporter (DMT)-like permease